MEPRLKNLTQVQCSKCPWKVSTNPHEIPDGYSVEKHKNLKDTIAKDTQVLTSEWKIMACHNLPFNSPKACIGWLHNQLGTGNNIPLRLYVMSKTTGGNYTLDGEQHLSFADTLPK